MVVTSSKKLEEQGKFKITLSEEEYQEFLLFRTIIHSAEMADLAEIINSKKDRPKLKRLKR